MNEKNKEANNYDEIIKRLNLFLTNTINKINYKSVDLEQMKIDAKDSISLYDMISYYFKLHALFKNEYDALNKINLGKYVEALCFSKDDRHNNHERYLSLFIVKPHIINYPYIYLYLMEMNDKRRIIVSHENDCINDIVYYYFQKNGLDGEMIKNYLDLFEKYQNLLKLYALFKNNTIFDNGVCQVSTVIDNNSGSILNSIDSFEININTSFNQNVHIYFQDALNVDLSKSFCNFKTDADNELYIDLLKKIYINKDYLSKSIDIDELIEKKKMLIK